MQASQQVKWFGMFPSGDLLEPCTGAASATFSIETVRLLEQ